MTEKDILTLIEKDQWMMDALRAARKLNLPDWMIGAGFVRAKVWDHLHSFEEKTPLDDVDLIYFDPKDLSEESEKEYDRQLKELFDTAWSTKNQARMHIVNEEEPYLSSEDGLTHWIEVPTCIAVTLLDDDSLKLTAPHGTDDLVSLKVKPTPFARARRIFPERMAKKKWKEKWPLLEILES